MNEKVDANELTKEDLARIIQEGCDSLSKKIDQIGVKLNRMHDALNKMDHGLINIGSHNLSIMGAYRRQAHTTPNPIVRKTLPTGASFIEFRNKWRRASISSQE